MRVVLLLRDLAIGGAERQFVQLAAGLGALGHEVVVLTRHSGGVLGERLPRAVERRSLFGTARAGVGGLAAAARLARTPARLRSAVAEVAPDVVYSALYVTNALAHRSLAGTATPLVWGFRGARQPLPGLRGAAFRYDRRHAPDVALAVFNSRAGLRYHEERGFRFRASEVVPNGIDVAAFAPASGAGAAFRARLGVPAEAFLVGTVGRLDPVKDHATFLEAAALFSRGVPGARFVCVGGGDERLAAELAARARRLGLGERVLWTGPVEDVAAAYAALDLFVQTSRAEGFPNAAAEAMASARACVLSDVGDSAWLAGDAAQVVPAGDPRAQAEAWDRLHALSADERAALGRLARERVAERFGTEACARATAEALGRAVAGA